MPKPRSQAERSEDRACVSRPSCLIDGHVYNWAEFCKDWATNVSTSWLDNGYHYELSIATRAPRVLATYHISEIEVPNER